MRYALIVRQDGEFIVDRLRRRLVCSTPTGTGRRIVGLLNSIGTEWWNWTHINGGVK